MGHTHETDGFDDDHRHEEDERSDYAEEPEEEDPMKGIPPARPLKLAVFGGSFDPIHNGHLTLAYQIILKGYADEVLFVPALIPPHKQDAQLASAEDRMAMLKLALDTYEPPPPPPPPPQEEEEYPMPLPPKVAANDDANGDGQEGSQNDASDEAKEEDAEKKEEPQTPPIVFYSSDIELQRQGTPSYTIDTLHTISRIYPDREVLFIMGMDSLRGLHTWHQAVALASRYKFLIYPRPNVLPPPMPLLIKSFGYRIATKLFYSILPEDEIQLSDLSSSRIRQGIAAGEDMSANLPPAVLDYIQQHNLYR